MLVYLLHSVYKRLSMVAHPVLEHILSILSHNATSWHKSSKTDCRSNSGKSMTEYCLRNFIYVIANLHSRKVLCS